MNSKYLATLFLMFGLLFTIVQGRRLKLPRQETTNSDTSSEDDNSDSSDDMSGDAAAEERRAIRNFLEGEDEASQFLEHSRRLFSSDLGHLKEAKEGYEEGCESLIPNKRYCPHLTQCPAWNQAWNAAGGK